ncbi:hypothetical protein [Chitinimonas sp. BJYL2]|uniref:hypothetical protein n=1 Tax=Chitinimonas sp. BJYL2 TaxID=2976696 RepID=UPI0022B4E432|nr:hypothetical protein [Chitinimonas sp. BJYL2]
MNTCTRDLIARLGFIAVLALSAYASVHTLTEMGGPLGEQANYMQAAIRPMA